MNKKYLILIVIYNIRLEESPSFQSLIKSKRFLQNSKIVIWDNSPRSQIIDKEKSHFFKNIEYIHTSENSSLSVIYNKVIDNNNGFDYMILLDQDSSFSEIYLEEIEHSVKANNDINLFLPIVKSNDTIVSPGDYKIFKGSYWKKEKYGKMKSKNIIAINSGMVINFNYLKSVFRGYDERLRFYGIDTYFMFEYAVDNVYCYVLNYTFSHESALLDNDEDIDKKLFRLQDLFFSWKITNDKKKINLIFINFYILIKIFKLVIKYKNIKYFELLKVYIRA